MDEKRMTFDDLLNEVNASTPQEEQQHSYDDDFLLTDEEDKHILMHRETHFGGQFPFMLDYYDKGGPGIDHDISHERLRYLAHVEAETKENLAVSFLSGPDAELIGRSKETYTQLKAIYEIEKADSPIPQLVADLILSEKEEPEEEIAALVSQGSQAVPALLQLLQNEDFFSPYFPGYGHAPLHASRCLGEIGDEACIRPLFEILNGQNFNAEMAALSALRQIGSKAKEFLIQALSSRPLANDNTSAAIALVEGFPGEVDIAVACFEQLKQPETHNQTPLANLLICGCEYLPSSYHSEFKELCKEPVLLEKAQHEIEAILQVMSR